MVTGEYGDRRKRPHWHAILFNYYPPDPKTLRKTDRGDQVFTSKTLENIWNRGILEFGSVTLESANYVARYTAKKLVHGKDQDHDFQPIHHTSSKNAIGKRWIERYWKQTFELGYVTLPDGQRAGIPRYYKDWLKKHNPSAYERYVTHVLPTTTALAEEANYNDECEYWKNVDELEQQQKHSGFLAPKRSKVKDTILKSKFKQHLGHQKL